MERVARGDQQAFAALYDELASRILGVVVRIVRDRALADEVTQEVFVEMWRIAPRYDASRAGVPAWATTIARRRAIDRVRSEQAARDRIQRLPPPHVEPGPDETAADRDAVERLRRGLERIPADQRAVLELAFLEGRTHTDIAGALDLPVGTVKGRVRLGLKRLRAQLEELP